MNRLPEEPVERTLRIIAGRWKVSILQRLMERPLRQSELLRLIPGITQKVLLQQLRELETHGMVVRTVFPVIPPRVEYSLTPLARGLAPLGDALCDWGRRHAAEVGAGEPAATGVS
jgi:DNA-binding HxlR family transcriptional regulator